MQSIENIHLNTKQPTLTPRNQAGDTIEPNKKAEDLEGAKASDEENDLDPQYGGQQTVITKFNADGESAMTFQTDATSALTSHPLSISNALTTSSKLELQLMFLAKELETEKHKREQLQKQVEVMHDVLVQHKQEAEVELAEHAKVKKKREANVKPLVEDLEDRRVMGRGGLSIQ